MFQHQAHRSGMRTFMQQIKAQSIEAFAEALHNDYQLDTVDLRGPISDLGATALRKALQDHPTLTSLKIFGDMTSFVLDELAAIVASNHSLENLIILGSSLNNIVSLQNALSINLNITTLELVNLDLGDPLGLALGVVLKKNNSIRRLNVTKNNLTNEGFTALIQGIKHNPTLNILVADQNQINDLNSLVEALNENNTLHSLSLNNNQLDDKAVELLINSKIKCLRFLSLAYNQIRPLGFIDLAQGLEKHENLTSLNASGNPGKEGCVAIIESQRYHPKLLYLNIADTLFDDSLMEQCTTLSSNPRLQTLDLSKNPLTEAGCHKLADLLQANVSIQDVNLFNIPINRECRNRINETFTRNKQIAKSSDPVLRFRQKAPFLKSEDKEKEFPTLLLLVASFIQKNGCITPEILMQLPLDLLHCFFPQEDQYQKLSKINPSLTSFKEQRYSFFCEKQVSRMDGSIVNLRRVLRIETDGKITVHHFEKADANNFKEALGENPEKYLSL